jgi:hypothetical protein
VKKLLLFLIILVSFCLSLCAQTPGVFPSYYAQLDADLTADPASNFWKGIPGLVIDHSILGQPEPTLRSEARSRWTDKNLYFLFFGAYDVLTLRPDPRTDVETFHLWDTDVFELYLGADFEHINRYGEFEVSPQGEFLDLTIDSTKPRPGWSDERLWNSGWQVKARIDQASHIWYAEVRIPIAAIDTRTPQIGNEFRVNVYRLHGTGPGRQRPFLAWQPTGVYNPHHPEKFGILKLLPTSTAEPK